MKLWIRIDTAVRSDPNVAELASRLGITIPQAIGHLVLVWSAAAEHFPDGCVFGKSAEAFSEMAGFQRKKGRPNYTDSDFGAVFLELFVRDGYIRGWRERQGKLIERAEKERARKLRGSSAENVGNSAPTERNGTISTISAEQPAGPEGVEGREDPAPHYTETPSCPACQAGAKISRLPS